MWRQRALLPITLILLIANALLNTVKSDIIFSTCYDGYTLSADGSCIQQLDEDPNLYCANSELAEGNTCTIRMPFLSRCEGSLVPRDGKCFSSTIKYPNRSCPVGFIADSAEGCYRQEAGKLVESCGNLRANLISGLCVLEIWEPKRVMYVCPGDSELGEEGTCWHTMAETYDCTDEFVAVPRRESALLGAESANPYFHQVFDRSRMLNTRSLITSLDEPQRLEEPLELIELETKAEFNDEIMDENGGLEYSTSAMKAETVDVEPSSSKREAAGLPTRGPAVSRVEVLGHLCRRKVQVDPIEESVACAAGFAATNDGCIMKKSYTPKLTCAATGGPAELCPSITTRASKTLTCNSGAIYDSTIERCRQDIITEREYFCPEGFLPDNESCVGFVDAIWECGPGLIPSSDGTRCLGTRIQPSIRIKVTGPFPEGLNGASLMMREATEISSFPQIEDVFNSSFESSNDKIERRTTSTDPPFRQQSVEDLKEATGSSNSTIVKGPAIDEDEEPIRAGGSHTKDIHKKLLRSKLKSKPLS